MASIGEGAARGIESGFRMGQTLLDRRDQEEQRRLQREQQAALDAERQADRAFNRERLQAQDARLAQQDLRQAKVDERQQNLDAEQALATEFGDLQQEGRGLLEQYGDFSKVPKDLGDSYALRVRDTRGRLNAQRAKRYAPLVEDQRRQAGELWSRIQAGQIPLEQVPDDQLVSSLTALTRRDVSDLMPGPGGAPSPVQQAGLDFMAGAQSGNDEMMLNAANVLFKPELMIGVGGPGRDGSEILSKKIVQLIPHPNDPQHFTPLLEVKVRREDGKVGTYRAPVTVNRSAEPDDDIRTISMQDGLDRVGRLTTLAEALNQRGIVEKLQAGQAAAGDGPKNFLEAYYATGGQKPKPVKADIGHFEDFGGYKVHYLPDGREVVIKKTATPTSGGGATESGTQMRNLDSALQSGLISKEEYTQRRRDLVLGTDKGKGAAGNASEDERKAAGWLSQARFAFDNMQSAIAENPDAAKPGVIQEMVGAIPKVGPALKNSITGEARQKFEQASSSFAEAALRAATGAGVTHDEAVQKIRELTPQIGDGPGLIKQKRQALEVYLQSLEARAGRAASSARPAGTGVQPAASAPAAAQPAAPAPGMGVQPGVNLGPSRVPPRPQAQPQQQPQQITEGAIAVNPATGQRIQLKGGQWVPVQ